MVDRDFTLADLIRVYQDAAWRVLNDPAAWQAEVERTDPAPLPWPFPSTGTQFQRLLAMLASADVDVLIVLLNIEDGRRLQTLLRVAVRSMLAGEAAIIKTIGPGRITGWNAYKKAVAEQADAYARSMVRPGLSLRKITKLLGLPRSTLYRANERRR